VRTNIAEVERYRPEELRNEPVAPTAEMQAGLVAFKNLLRTSMPPDRVAEMVFDAIENEQFYIFTHPEWTEVIQLRMENLLHMENPQNPAAALARAINYSRTKEEMHGS
jgi:hypothetical protein